MGTLDTRTRTSTAVSCTLARGLASVRLRIQTQDAATCANARNRTKPHAASGLSLANLPKKKKEYFILEWPRAQPTTSTAMGWHAQTLYLAAYPRASSPACGCVCKHQLRQCAPAPGAAQSISAHVGNSMKN